MANRVDSTRTSNDVPTVARILLDARKVRLYNIDQSLLLIVLYNRQCTLKHVI